MKNQKMKGVVALATLAAIAATDLSVVARFGIAKENVDWSKVAWTPAKSTSPWKEWNWNPKKEGRSWKYVEELSQAEKDYWQIDGRWSHEIPRDKEYPKLPEERYPFKAPYSGEELSALGEAGGGGTVMCGLQSHSGYHISRTKDRNGVISKSDTICNTIRHYKTFAEQLYKFKPGQETGAYLVVVANPPESAGTVSLSKFYKDGPGVSKLEDRWAYLPSLRRVRRISGASGSDYIPGSVATYDDVFLRDFWKYDSKVIGVDILYQAVNSKKPYGPIAGPYRADGGIETYVVLNKPVKNGYYLSHWISWHEKKTGHIIRQEQWDRKGNFKKVSEKGLSGQVLYFNKLIYPWSEGVKGGLTENGAERRAILHGGGPEQVWDVEQDVQVYSIPDTPDKKISYEKFGNLDAYAGKETWKQLFQPQRIENPFVKPVPVVKFEAKDFPPTPPLYREKFSKFRKISLPAEILQKIKKDEQSKRGLFKS
ncbi:outer membrane lipoprotein-sorting protein [Geotalea toluenoxydans]|uniref:outer membrane lipoprotein-sorting protein n=1 Tax=Geotalea toluenoxydans TaxID=421624 RepID=UPI0006CFA21C|nr:outer membrane lipoprotein-sorting protein [Geotalea toluenoxydans]